MSVFLKVKLKSLAAEARLIKHEENKRKVRRIPSSRRNYGGRTEAAKTNAAEIRAADRDIRAERRGKDWYPKSAEELHKLHRHRVDVVKKEARLTSIAYGFLRGRKLEQVDSGAGLSQTDWQKVITMVRKYGSADQSVAQWAGLDWA